MKESVLFTRLHDVDAADLARAGGKAFNCARLLRAGFPVPDGVVVAPDAPGAAIQHLPDDPWFDSLPADQRFAVRSSGIGEDSAGHSFAGIHETQLNVERAGLVEAVIACRRSADSAAARAYRAARQIAADDARIGVLVQVMVPATTSGVAFTVNPITGADELVINSGRGLGEALVSGQIDPDEFHVSKRGAVLSMRLGAAATRWRPHARAGRRDESCSRASSSTTARRRTSSGATTAHSSGSSSRVRSRPAICNLQSAV